jgi:hypothetical protein
MTARRAVRIISRGVTAAVLAVSAVYLLVYLYRWEWNRAVISGVFFLAAELVLATVVLSARMTSLERRLDDLAAGAGPGPGTPGPAVEADVDVERESPFAWLDPASGRMGVFVPFLMGAGVILSGVAFVVEKLSGAVASTASDRSPPRAGPPLPAGGLLAGAPPPPTVLPGGTAGRRTPPVFAAAAVAVTGLVAFQVVGLVADATQARGDPHPDLTTIEVDVRTRDARAGAAEEAAALWVACQGRLDLDRAEVTETGPGRARLSITAVLGESARRKFVGCLEDATLERVRAGVVSVSTFPAAVAPPPAPPG